MQNTKVDILILGAGWTSNFLIPLCNTRSVSYAATSRSGRDATIKFEFDQESDDPEPYRVLPEAKTVLITFPITRKGASGRLVKAYKDTHPGEVAFIQLGTTSIWDGTRNITVDRKIESKWYDRHSPFISNDRSNAEDELLALSPGIPTTILNLSGLWGGQRSMKNWVGRVAPTKEALKNKGSIHMIHGLDVSRAILAVHSQMSKAAGQRWLLTDGRVYDWWDLASAWGSVVPAPPASPSLIPTTPTLLAQSVDSKGPQPQWTFELMREQNIRALPRDIGSLGRALDSTEFWIEFGLTPAKARLDGF